MNTLKIKRTNLFIFMFSLSYCFRFAAKIIAPNNGNLDIFYLLGCISLLFCLQNKKDLKKLAMFGLAVTTLELLSVLFGPMEVDINKGLIWIAKIMLCYSAYIRFQKRPFTIKELSLFVKYCGLIFFFQTLFALLYKTDLTWRMGENRLELFFLEPSELGMFVSLIFILALYIFKYQCNKKDKTRVAISMLILLIIMVLSQSAAGFIYLVLGSICILFYDTIFLSSSKKHIGKSLVLVFVCILAVVIVVNSSSYVAMRLIGIANGTDGSFWSRIPNSYLRVLDYLKNTSLVGCGLGNQNSIYGNEFFRFNGVDQITTFAAFATFGIETGIIGIFLEMVFVKHIISKLKHIKTYKELRFALSVVSFSYFFSGGYVTNIAVWMCIGLILNTKDSIYTNNACQKYAV